MKNLFIITCILFLSCTAFGQQIKSKNVELDDLIALLASSGYELFSYDISEMLNERYDITFIQKEFEAGNEIASSNLTMMPNKRLLTDIPESFRQEFIDAGRIIDPKTQAISHIEKITFGFSPFNDSTKFIQISESNRPIMGRSLKLRGLTTKDSDKMFFYYHTRPFKLNVFKEDEFIPLILFGSGLVR